MPVLIDAPTIVQAAGNQPKSIAEFAGLVNNNESRLSIAVMTSPPGWFRTRATSRF